MITPFVRVALIVRLVLPSIIVQPAPFDTSSLHGSSQRAHKPLLWCRQTLEDLLLQGQPECVGLTSADSREVRISDGYEQVGYTERQGIPEAFLLRGGIGALDNIVLSFRSAWGTHA